MEETKGQAILRRSATYLREIEKIPGGEKIMARHRALEGFLLWPKAELGMGIEEALKALKKEGFDTREAAIKRDLQLYRIVSEALQLGKRGKESQLEIEAESFYGKAPVLECPFSLLMKIILEVEKSLKDHPTEATIAPSPVSKEPKIKTKAKAKKAPKLSDEPEDKGKEGKGKTEELEARLADEKRAAGQQALKVLKLNIELAQMADRLKKEEKKFEDLTRQNEEVSKENIGLKREVSLLKSQIEELQQKLAEATKKIEEGQRATVLLGELEYFFQELKKDQSSSKQTALKTAEHTGEKGDPKEGPKRISRFMERIPKVMEANSQPIVHGPDLEKSAKNLTEDEEENILEALRTFAKKGGRAANLNTRKFGRTTISSNPGFRISFSSDKKLGFTWLGSKGTREKGGRVVIYEIVRVD